MTNTALADIDTEKQPIVAPRLTLAFTTPIDTRLDAVQRDLLTALSNACRRRGVALYGPLYEAQRACRRAFHRSDLERLYELGYVSMSHDQGDWYYIEVENAR